MTLFVGMLLRMFVLLYDTEVVEEEAFLRWKEDVSEKHPGKGKALFQVITSHVQIQVFTVASNISTQRTTKNENSLLYITFLWRLQQTSKFCNLSRFPWQMLLFKS